MLKRIARRRRRSIGLPPGVPFETLDEVCQAEWGRRLGDAWHTPISSWKGSSAAFVWLQMEGRATKRVVVKLSRYEAEVFLTSIESLVEPGPAELWVYNEAGPSMAAFLPHAYLAARVESGQGYLFVLDDLTEQYAHDMSPQGWRNGINGLFRMHSALASAVDAYGSEQLLRFDADFSSALIPYAENAIAAYDAVTGGSSSAQVLQAWPRLQETYLDDEFDLPNGGIPIHGDYNTSNVFIHRRDNQVKAVDWEWAGLGSPHADLASYLKNPPIEVITWALDQIAERDESRTRYEHERMFLRSTLERAIWDASLQAMQFTSDRNRFGYLGPRVNRALQRSLRSLDQLRTA